MQSIKARMRRLGMSVYRLRQLTGLDWETARAVVEGGYRSHRQMRRPRTATIARVVAVLDAEEQRRS